MATPALAQVSGSIDLESEYRFRGYSLSAGEPVVTGQLGYDDISGLYANGSLIGQLGGDKARYLGFIGNIGFAKRLSPTVSLDGGVLHASYEPSYDGGFSRHYTEVYAGLTVDRVTARVSYSPDYFHSGVSILYGEVEAAAQPAKHWRLNAHIGSLVYLGTPAPYVQSRAAHYDWRLGAARQLGSFELHVAVSGGGPGRDYYDGESRSKTAVTGGVSWSF